MNSPKLRRLRTLRLTKVRDLGTMGQLMSVHLRSLHVYLSKALTAETEARGLKAGNISALSLIAANPGISQNEVGETIGTDRTTMVQLMDILEKRGWIDRKRSEIDRRKYLLYVTDEGRARLDEIVSSVKHAEEALLQTIPPDDRRLLRSLLERARTACRGNIEQAELLGRTDELYRQV